MTHNNNFLIRWQEIISCFFTNQNQPPDNLFNLSNQLKKYVIILFLLIVTPQYILAQSETDALTSSSSNEALVNAMNSYNNAIGKNLMVFTGSYYFDKNLGINGHPFFMNNYWEIGTIVYEGQQYDSIEIRYDIYRDLLLIKYIDKHSYVMPIELQSSKVEEFIIMGHHFLRLEEDTLSDFKTGFFDLLQEGEKSKVIAKRKKEISSTHISDNQLKEYFLNDKLYIISGHDYFEIKGKKSLLTVLSDRKNEVKEFLKTNKARFRKDHERQLIEVVIYYNSIVNNEGS